MRVEGIPFGDVFGFRRGHEAFGEELGEVLAEGFDLALIGQFFRAVLLGEVAVVEGFDFLFDEADAGIDEEGLGHLRQADEGVGGDELGFQIGQRADAVVVPEVWHRHSCLCFL